MNPVAEGLSGEGSSLASRLVATLEAQQLSLVLAESLTGGSLSSAIVSVPGASKVLLGCIVAYDSQLKQALLSVSSASLKDFGAASAEVAGEMARGARALAAQSSSTPQTSVVAVSTTGVAGPDIQDGVPVGKVYIAIDGPKLEQEVLEFDFDGDRQSIREQTVDAALKAVLNRLSH